MVVVNDDDETKSLREDTEDISCNNDQDQENIIELEEDWGDEFNNVVTILCGLHLNQYVEMFVNQGITLDIFLHLNEDDLCHIGMASSEDRVNLLRGIAQLTRSRSKMSDEVSQTNLSLGEVKTMMVNIVKHLTVIHASLAHTRLTLSNSGTHNSRLNLRLTSAELMDILASKGKIETQLIGNRLSEINSKKLETEKKTTSKWKFHLTMLSSVGILCFMIFCVKKVLGSNKNYTNLPLVNINFTSEHVQSNSSF